MEPRHAGAPGRKWRVESCQENGQPQPVITSLQTQSAYSFRLMGVGSRGDERNVISLQSPRGNWGKKALESGVLMVVKITRGREGGREGLRGIQTL